MEDRILKTLDFDGQPPVTTDDAQRIDTLVRKGWAVRPDPTPEEVAAAHVAAQAQAWERIKAKRDALKSGGVMVAGKWFHSDPDSRIQQLVLVLMGTSVPAVQWKTLDGSFTPMSQALAGGIFQAVAGLDMALFAAAEAHKAAMIAAADPLAYDCSGNWPATYQS